MYQSNTNSLGKKVDHVIDYVLLYQEQNEREAVCFSLFGTPVSEIKEEYCPERNLHFGVEDEHFDSDLKRVSESKATFNIEQNFLFLKDKLARSKSDFQKDVTEHVSRVRNELNVDGQLNNSHLPLLDLEEKNQKVIPAVTFTEPLKATFESTPMTVTSFSDLNFQKLPLSNGCKCRKSKCLRLHCVCFKEGGYCGSLCGCVECVNKTQFESAREFVIKKTLEINPLAFSTKLQQLGSSDKVVNNQGCNCSRNNCNRNYCACFKNGIGCSSLCRCETCLNGKQQLDDKEKVQILKKISRKKHKIVISSKIVLEDEKESCKKTISYVLHRKRPKSERVKTH